MSVFEAIILGIVQGLTEFLPVSSSGHIELSRAILGMEPENNVLLQVIVHTGTALATVLVYRKDIAKILAGLVRNNREERDFALKIIVSMIPAAAIGLLFEAQIEAAFGKYLWLIGLCLLVTAALLLLADRAKHTDKPVGFAQAAVIGVAQAVAILPGISRSGATISTAVLLKIDRGRAARFSFLMVLPLIFGKMAKDLAGGELNAHPEMTVPLIAAFVASLLVGVAACRIMIYLVKQSQLKWFSYYCFAVGLVAFSTLWWL